MTTATLLVELKHYPVKIQLSHRTFWNIVYISYCAARCYHLQPVQTTICCLYFGAVAWTVGRCLSLITACSSVFSWLCRIHICFRHLLLCNCGRGLWLCCCSEKWFVPLHHMIVLFSLVQRVSGRTHNLDEIVTIVIALCLLCGCLQFSLFSPVISFLLGCAQTVTSPWQWKAIYIRRYKLTTKIYKYRHTLSHYCLILLSSSMFFICDIWSRLLVNGQMFIIKLMLKWHDVRDSVCVCVWKSVK